MAWGAIIWSKGPCRGSGSMLRSRYFSGYGPTSLLVSTDRQLFGTLSPCCGVLLGARLKIPFPGCSGVGSGEGGGSSSVGLTDLWEVFWPDLVQELALSHSLLPALCGDGAVYELNV